MSRRLLAALAAVCIAALSVTAVALAHGGSGHKDHRSGARVAHGRPAGFLGGGFFGVALDSLAQRLGVAPAELRTAVQQVTREQWDKKLQAAGLTPEEIAALESCRHALAARHGVKARPAQAAGCDSAAWSSGIGKLKAAPKVKPDLAALKAELATSLATRLGKTPDEILTAVRAELDARLTQAVTAGWLTQKGHDLALACFDDPATCDLTALRAEVTFFGNGRHHRHHPGAKPAPGDTSSGSGRMTPGGRSSSAPLR